MTKPSSTQKKPVKPNIDHDQGKNLYSQLINQIAAFRKRLIESWEESKHGDGRVFQRTGTFIRKDAAKKKRKRKIAHRSKRINRMRSK